MSKYRLAFHLSLLLLTALSSTTVAQSSVCADQLSAGVPCCGQYECMEERPLSRAQAQASRGYPQFARSEPDLNNAPGEGHSTSSRPSIVQHSEGEKLCTVAMLLSHRSPVAFRSACSR